jgi:hypothetical protein
MNGLHTCGLASPADAQNLVSNTCLRHSSFSTEGGTANSDVYVKRLERLVAQARRRSERRRLCSIFVWNYYRYKFHKQPDHNNRISICWLREHGFYHRNPRQPQSPRLYYNDVFQLEMDAGLLLNRLERKLLAARCAIPL